MPSRGNRGHSKSKQREGISSLPAQGDECTGGNSPYTELFEAVPQAIALWQVVRDENGAPCDLRVCTTNSLFREYFGLPDEVGRRSEDIDPRFREKQPDIASIVTRVSSTGVTEKHELFHPGLKRWLEFRATTAPQGLVITYIDDITDRVEAESALRRVRYTLDHSEDYPAWTDSQGRIIDVSDSTCSHLEYSREELLNMTLFDICPDIDPETYARSWKRGADLEPFRRQVRHRTKSGRVYPVEVSVSHMIFDGKPYHCALCRDISERQEADKALRDSEELHRQFFELESDAIILADDVTGEILEANEAACSLYGYTKTEFLSLSYADAFVEPFDPDALTPPADGEVAQRWHKKRDGTVFPVQMQIRRFEWKGRPVHVTAVRDVTDLKRATDELEESKRMLRSVLDTVPSPILWRDRDLRYLGCNAIAATQALLPDPSAIVGLSHHELPVHTLGEQVDLVDREVIETGRPRLGYEETVVRSNGETVVLRTSKVPLRNSAGEVIGVLSIHDDITEQTEMLSALRDRDDQLLQAQKMEAIGRLAGGIAHDFNNVLTTIVGYSDLLLSSPDCPEGSVTEDITEIKRAAERAGALTHRILAFSRRQNMQPALLSLNDVVADIEKLLARTIGADIELTTSLAAKLGKVEVDEQQFVQVLLNLAVNARDAMPKGGKLTISTADVTLDEQFCETHPEVSPGPYVMLTVADTGLGMDEEVLGHVFEPFYTTKPPGLGTGLGLATVYGIIAQSGGCIYVHSSVDRGTTFTIYLPRLLDDSETSDSTGPDTGPESALSVIMVVDSDAPYLALTTRFLERRGFKVLPVSDGEKAAKILADRSTKVTGLVTDLVLSGALQGEQLAELATRRRPGLKLLFVSSEGSDAQAAADSSRSAAVYLEKPFTAEELHREVRTWVTVPDPASKGAG